eukprot:TRINITY_DN1840_c0_g1_i1.p1 TRINITY_DN1840_c0_g1~~TRINITY_DN1840_c0_g1_i1.p1  ORF type:complete len:178 (-),score=27.93 TRINITY_DN1840_c0_g1_i1:278-811(-)
MCLFANDVDDWFGFLRPLACTQRLVLRYVTLDKRDVAAFVAMRTDPDVARFQGWEPKMNERKAKQQIAGMRYYCTTDKDETVGQLGVALKDTNELVGYLTYVIDSSEREAELGITIAKQYWGKGYGFEALTALITWLYEESEFKNLDYVYALVDPLNVASMALMKSVTLLSSTFCFV